MPSPAGAFVGMIPAGSAIPASVQSNVWPGKPAWMAASARTACGTSFATIALDNGVAMHDLQDSLGQADPRTTRGRTTSHGTSWRSLPATWRGRWRIFCFPSLIGILQWRHCTYVGILAGSCTLQER